MFQIVVDVQPHSRAFRERQLLDGVLCRGLLLRGAPRGGLSFPHYHERVNIAIVENPRIEIANIATYIGADKLPHEIIKMNSVVDVE